MTFRAPPSTLPAIARAAFVRSSLILDAISFGSLGRSPLFWKKFSASLRYRSAVFAMPGNESAREESCCPTSGARKSATSTTSQTKSRNESRIDSPRGMNQESQRTGKESARASAKPPTTVVSTLGTYQITKPSTTSTARIRAVRVRFEIQIGVGWAVTSGSALDCPLLWSSPTSRFTSHSPRPNVRPPRSAEVRARLPALLDPDSDARDSPTPSSWAVYLLVEDLRSRRRIYVGITAILVLELGFVYLPFMNILLGSAP